MDFVSKTEDDKDYHRSDRLLLMLSNYVFNNVHQRKRSAHYSEIEKEINAIAPEFFDIANKFRPLTSRSPALSDFSLQNKMDLMSIVEKYFEEIQRDSSEKVKSNEFDLDSYEEEFNEEDMEKPLSAGERFNLERFIDVKEETQDTQDAFTDQELESSTEFGPVRKSPFQKIDRLTLQSVVAPTPEFRQNAVGLLIHYIQTYRHNPPQETKGAYQYIMNSVKFLVPSFFSRLKEFKGDMMQTWTPRELDNLYNIACMQKDVLNQFQEQLEINPNESKGFKH